MMFAVSSSARKTEMAPVRIRSFVFLNMIGAGFSFLLTEQSGLSLEYRFRHVSNADIQKPNRGLDSHIAAIGYSLFF